ncbi:MAG: nitroreductase family deazaflavin-dependent oxidoreductase [Anaerolineae bacterium]|nr:nitroreductase family deazaflavin-dependent oxidoreductase [Anaerolineae bacterium]
MPTARRSQGLKLFWRLHRWLFHISGGRLGANLFGNKILMLTTVGHKSGQPRNITIYYYPYQNGHVIIGSNAGHDRHPAWYLNLKAQPEVTVQIGAQPVQMLAREAEGSEREKLWTDIVTNESSYADYQNMTQRMIPVVVLEPIESLAE